MHDGVLYVIAFARLGWRRWTRPAGVGRPATNRGGDIASGRRVEIHTPAPIPFTLDGERAGSTPLVAEIRPGACRVLVPAAAKMTPPGGPSLPRARRSQRARVRAPAWGL